MLHIVVLCTTCGLCCPHCSIGSCYLWPSIHAFIVTVWSSLVLLPRILRIFFHFVPMVFLKYLTTVQSQNKISRNNTKALKQHGWPSLHVSLTLPSCQHTFNLAYSQHFYIEIFIVQRRPILTVIYVIHLQCWGYPLISSNIGNYGFSGM